jgi:hypothetical protein
MEDHFERVAFRIEGPRSVITNERASNTETFGAVHLDCAVISRPHVERHRFEGSRARAIDDGAQECTPDTSPTRIVGDRKPLDIQGHATRSGRHEAEHSCFSRHARNPNLRGRRPRPKLGARVRERVRVDDDALGNGDELTGPQGQGRQGHRHIAGHEGV